MVSSQHNKEVLVDLEAVSSCYGKIESSQNFCLTALEYVVSGIITFSCIRLVVYKQRTGINVVTELHFG